MKPLTRLRRGWVLLTGTGAAASIAFGLLVFAAVLASLAIPREGVALRTQALRRTLAGSPPANRTVIGTVSMASLLPAGSTPVSAITTVRATLAARLAAHGVPLASNPPAWSGLTSAYAPVTGAPATAGEQGGAAVAAREYAVLDRAGRIQFPRGMIERLGMRDRVELREEADHIGVWADDAPDQEPGAQ